VSHPDTNDTMSDPDTTTDTLESADAPSDETETVAADSAGAVSPDTADDSSADDDADAVSPEASDSTDAAAVSPEASDSTASDSTDVEDLLEEAAAPKPMSPFDRPGRWYVVHTQSGYEKKVKQNLEARTSSMNMEDRIHEVVIPMEDVVEFKNGKKVVVQKKMFPGYLLVRCFLDDDSWYVIRNTPGVTGFVGQGAKPSPLPRKDVESFLQVKVEGEELPAKRGKPRLEYELGESVRVKEGPFADFSGEVVELNEDQLKVKVLVNIFGRETPVELEFSQIAKL
jgi:transcription termination/antitermination protein NusG